MSKDRYANMIAINIWIDYIVENNVGIQTPITRSEGELGKFNPTDYNMSDELAIIQTRRMMPRGFRRIVDSYQQSMLDPLAGQPEGFLKFTKQWKKIIKQIADYEGTTEVRPDNSRRDIRRNIRNMFNALNTLIDSGSYFTHQDFLSTEGITQIVNPNNNTPIGNSNTTNWEFGSAYESPTPPSFTAFSNLAILFPAVPPVPTGLIGRPLTLWLTSSGLIAPTNPAAVRTALIPINLLRSFTDNNFKQLLIDIVTAGIKNASL